MRLVVDALLPQRCAACAAPGAGWCSACTTSAEALRLHDGAGVLLTPQIAAVGVFAYDGVVRDAIRGMKLSGRHAAAASFGEVLRGQPAVPPAWPVTWVPSTPRRRRERGVEIPRLLAGKAAQPLLRRLVERPDQTELSAQQRREFPSDAFVATAAPPDNVVLVDDVRTTGATAVAAAGALISAGARRVLVATFAVGGDNARATSRQTAAST